VNHKWKCKALVSNLNARACGKSAPDPKLGRPQKYGPIFGIQIADRPGKIYVKGKGKDRVVTAGWVVLYSFTVSSRDIVRPSGARPSQD
jgi:hypothetical protein